MPSLEHHALGFAHLLYHGIPEIRRTPYSTFSLGGRVPKVVIDYTLSPPSFISRLLSLTHNVT